MINLDYPIGYINSMLAMRVVHSVCYRGFYSDGFRGQVEQSGLHQ
jgi:hypothetical protein